MEKELDNLQAKLFGKAEDQVRTWTHGSHYVTGAQLVAAGLAEMLDLP
jgi:hypothetical protein